MWFHTDVSMKYGKTVGSAGIATYMIVCTHTIKKKKHQLPSLDDIADEIQLSPDIVLLKIRQLEDLGFIEVEEYFNEKRKQVTYKFTLCDPNKREIRQALTETK